jgi:tetratricopeptide (TPR) repeat protein
MFASRKTRLPLLCLVLITATLLSYTPFTHNQFIDFDDAAHILTNNQVQQGLTWGTLRWSFTTFHAGYWVPLTWLSHALDCQFFHLNPAGHHGTNLIFHTANALLLFLLLRRATGATGASFVVALVFAVHPVNVESVAWAAERNNVLSMFFFLLALLAYDRYGHRPRVSLYLAVVVLFVLGLMAKPQIVTLPFVLLLWDYWPLQRMSSGSSAGYRRQVSPTAPGHSFGWLLLEKLPLLMIALADSVVTVIAQRAGSAVRTVNEVSVSARLENSVVSYARYLGKMLWPSRLAPMYPHPGNSLPGWQVTGASVLLIMISILVWRWRRRRYLAVGWFWFLGTMVPMIGLVTVGEQAMADRFLYLPAIGVLIATVWLLDAALALHVNRLWRTAAVALLALSLGCLTYRQVGRWRDDETLWRYTLSVTSRNYMAHDNLALALRKQGRSDEAVFHFQQAASLHQYPPNQLLDLANYELRVGHPQEAIQQCESVLRTSSDASLQAGAWSELGEAHLLLQEFDESSGNFQQALRLDSRNAIALVGTGLLALRHQQFGVAVDRFMGAALVEPTDVNGMLLAEALRRDGQAVQADSIFAQARKISPNPRLAQETAARMIASVGKNRDQ